MTVRTFACRLVLACLLLSAWGVLSAQALTNIRYHEPTGCYIPVGPATYATLNAAVTELTWDACLLLPRTRAGSASGNWSITTNLTIPRTITVRIELGPRLDIAGGVTLTACIDAGPYPIKTGSGTLTYPAGCALPNYPQHFGAVADGATDASAAFSAAITAWNSSAMLGGEVRVPAGSYLLATEVLIPYQAPTSNKGIKLIGDGAGATHLLAGTNNMSIVHWAGNNGLLEGFSLLANSKTGVSALRVTPADEAQTSTVVNQNYNTFRNLIIDGVAEGIVLACGPDVGGGDSGCWYNKFHDIHIHNSIRGIWMKDGPNASSSGVNRNGFFNIRIGAPGGGQANTGVHIVSGSTNEFHKVDCEGVSFGTSPHANPTCYVIEAAGAFSGDNNTNRFFGGTVEGAGSFAFENHNAFTEFYGMELGTSATDSFGASTVVPNIMIGGSNPSSIPIILPGGLRQQGNSQFASLFPAENNTWQFSNHMVLRTQKRLFDDTTQNTQTAGSSAGKWASYALSGSNVTNTASITASASYRQAIGGMVDWHVRIQFQASVAATAITIQLPIDPDDTVNRLNLTAMHWPVVVHNGVTTSVTYGSLAGASTPFTISIPAPSGNWDAAAANNLILFQIRYMGEGY